MKFALHYDGALPSAGNRPRPKDVWRIRKHFHPQLMDLWNSHPALKELQNDSVFPLAGGALIQGHHLHEGPLIMPFAVNSEIVGKQNLKILCDSIRKGNVDFFPLVRENFALHAGIKVHFLRKEPPGAIYQGGDLDGRIKTLLDALTMPQHPEQMVKDDDVPPLFYCLLEDDSMISGLQVESERLLNATAPDKNHVRLTIEVDVRLRQAKIYNQSFL